MRQCRQRGCVRQGRPGARPRTTTCRKTENASGSRCQKKKKEEEEKEEEEEEEREEEEEEEKEEEDDEG